jgi:ABC-type transport system involved in Fe-S cluster assembly fused permease/ATPase subunit
MFSITTSLKTVLPFLWREKPLKHKLAVIFSITLVFFTIVLNLSVPIIFKNIVNIFSDYSNFSGSKHNLTLILLVTYGICWTSATLFEKIREMLFFNPLQTAITDYSLAVFKHIHSLSLKFHLGRETGKVAGSIQRSQLAIAMLVTNLFHRIIPVFIEALLAFLILWHYYSIQIGLLVVGIIITYLLINYFIMDIFKKAEKKYQAIDIMVDKRVVDSLLNTENIKFLGAQDFEINTADKLMHQRENAIIQVFWSGTFTTCIQALVLGLGLTLITYIIGQKVLSGELTVGDFVLVNGYLLMLFNPLGDITGHIRNTLSNTAQLSHSINLLYETDQVKDSPNASKIIVTEATVKFENVYFSYHDNQPILKNFSLTIPAKSTVAIVGPSGSGKSTLSRLLFRFYDVNSGKILIDNQDIKQVTQKSLRQLIAAVPQDIVLLNNTLKYNICYGSFDATDKEIQKVITDVHLDKLLAQLPNGLDTLVGERGLKLSGGEKQRVGIARALLKKPKILLFDEATSSLDTQTEKIVQKNIEEVTQNITTILIAHRLSTVVHADIIIVLDKGIIIEQGTHDELLLNNGLYAQLWGQQHVK